MNIENLKKTIKPKRLRVCFCENKVRGRIHERQCIEKKIVIYEKSLKKIKNRFGIRSKEYNSAYITLLNCKRLFKDPTYLRKIYQKIKTKKAEKSLSENFKQPQVFDNCYCANRKHSKIPHEKQCLEKRKVNLWEKVKQAKEKGDLKEYNNAYQIYHVNERKIKEYEKNK